MSGLFTLYALDSRLDLFKKARNDLNDYRFKKILVKLIDLPEIDSLMKKDARWGDRVNPSNLVELVNNEDYKPDTSANEFLKHFSDDINFTKSVKKYPVSNARSCLIVIPQIHFTKNTPLMDSILPTLSSLMYAQINWCQKDIKFILEDMINKYDLSQIYCEGVTNEHTDDDLKIGYVSTLKSLAVRNYILFPRIEGMENLLNLELLLRIDAGEDDILKQIEDLNPNEQKAFEYFKYIPGGAYIPIFEGDLKRVAASNSRLNAVAGYLIERESGELINEFIYERREFFALKSCSNDTNDFSVLIYGGGHDFRDNILVWNKVHPDDKYSLIIVKPETYPDYIKKSN